MAILTIARECGAWTSADSELLAQKLDAVLLGKQELEKRLQDIGLTSRLFQRYDERKPGFFSAFSTDQDIYLLYLKTVLLQAAQEGNVVVLGRGAHLMLGDLPNCLRLRLVAPIEERLKRLRQEFGYDEDTANRMLHKCDADRAGFCHFHFNEAWDDATCYDLTINTSKLSPYTLANLVSEQLSSRITAQQENDSRKLIARRLLAQQIATSLLVDQKLSLAFLEVDVDDNGVATLQGTTTTPVAVATATATAAAIPGITKVDNQIRIAIELAHNGKQM